ncbi:guanylate kinase [Candidatus Berkelbacteria bacterium]|nr:guanylate kinase [Candidatus Berkelbacteria bacterium]
MHAPVPILIAGPSGVGKSTIIQAIVDRFPQLALYKTTTTRDRRSSVDDKYYFVSENEFKSLIEAGRMLEWAKVHGHYYGAQKKHIQEILDHGKFPLPENAVDVQGVRTYRKVFPGLLAIFVAFESLEELPKRIRKTRPEATEEEISTRLASAQREMAAIIEYRHVVINHEGKLDKAIQEVAGIIKKILGITPIAERSRTL